MKTTVDLPAELLEEAVRLSGLKTKRAVIVEALKEFIRRKRCEKLLSMLGRTEIALTQQELEELRADDTAGEGPARIVLMREPPVRGEAQ